MDGDGYKVLVLDDESHIRQSFSDYLEDRNFDVYLAENGRIGLEKIEKIPLDLVLLDLRMPEVDGLEVLKQGAKIIPDVPMIVISGANRLGDAVQALRNGAWDYIEKPVQDFALLGYTIEKVLEKARLKKENKAYQEQLEEMVKERTIKLEQVNTELAETNTQLRKTIDTNREKEKQLRHAQKMEAIGTLASGIAHDFNNILSSMIGFSELTKMELKNDPVSMKHLNQIIAGGIRARDLITQILTYSRDSNVETHIFSLTPIIKESIKFLKSSIPMNIKIESRLGSSPYSTLGNPTHFYQVLMNLYTNASHAMADTGGTLTVDIRQINVREGDSYYPRLKIEGSYVYLTVSDTGPGIPDDIVEQVFDPFFTTKKKGEGTGLGLSIVHGIIEEMKGAIWISSPPDQGTTFHILVPAAHSEKTNKTELMLPELDTSLNGTILLVDDDASLISWLTAMLIKLGFTVKGSTDTADALDIFEQNQADFDLVITDLTMPEMSGLELSDRIRQFNPEIPIIICTGSHDKLTDGLLKQYNIDAALKKPVLQKELLAAITKIMGSVTSPPISSL